MAELIRYCPDLTLAQAWKKLHELANQETTTIAYDQIHEAFLPDLKAFVVGRTQSGEAQKDAVTWPVFGEWLLKIFYKGFSYQIHFKVESSIVSVVESTPKTSLTEKINALRRETVG